MYEYSRGGNPTRNTLEKVLASLEAAKYGAQYPLNDRHFLSFFLLYRKFHFLQRPPGLAFSSGLAAVCSIVQLLSCGDHIVAMDDLYGGTSNYLKQIAKRMNIETTFVDATDAENVENVIQENTRVRFTCQQVDS